MGWFGGMQQRWRLRALLREAALANGGALSPGLASAVEETARVLPPPLLGPRLRSLHPRLVLVFARQRADANARLASDHWSSGGGRNVGRDVLAAEGRARAVLVDVASRRPPYRRPLTEVLERLDALIEAQRAGPGDEDGYGLATLHEIRRELAAIPEQRRASFCWELSSDR